MRVFWIMVLLCASALAQAEPTECALPNPGATFFALSVADAEKSARWYIDTFGFKLIKQGGAPDGKSKMRLVECNRVFIELVEHADAVSRATAAPTIKRDYLMHGYFKSGVFVDDIDTVLEVMKKKSVPVYGRVFEDEEMGIRSFLVRDSDNNVVQFFSKLVKSEIKTKSEPKPDKNE